MSRITWSPQAYSGHQGVAGGFPLFSTSWGTTRQEKMWSLSTLLPVRGRSIGQHYATEEEAMAAAEKVLAAFIERIAQEADQ